MEDNLTDIQFPSPQVASHAQKHFIRLEGVRKPCHQSGRPRRPSASATPGSSSLMAGGGEASPFAPRECGGASACWSGMMGVPMDTACDDGRLELVPTPQATAAGASGVGMGSGMARRGLLGMPFEARSGSGAAADAVFHPRFRPAADRLPDLWRRLVQPIRPAGPP